MKLGLQQVYGGFAGAGEIALCQHGGCCHRPTNNALTTTRLQTD